MEVNRNQRGGGGAELKTAIALKLHSYGLMQLHDPNWTGMELFDRLKQHTRGREQPTTMLFKPLRKGLLYHLGLWLYRDYFISDTHRMSLGSEYRLWYLEDLLELLKAANVPANDDRIAEATSLVEKIDALYGTDEKKYWRALDRDTVYEATDALIVKYENKLLPLSGAYAENYAERVFHDRQLCEHISKTLVAIGFDGRPDWIGPPRQWIGRLNTWPRWVVDAVVSRDRGLCARCGVSLTSELRAPKHIDHIIALANAGTNDLSNLQLLCDACNLNKSKRMIDVRSSIPSYLQLAREERAKD